MLVSGNDALFYLDNFAAKSLDSGFLFFKGLKQFDYDDEIRGNPFQFGSLRLLFLDQGLEFFLSYRETGDTLFLPGNICLQICELRLDGVPQFLRAIKGLAPGIYPEDLVKIFLSLCGLFLGLTPTFMQPSAK